MMNLRLGDCLSVLKEMPSASVDAVITDPPYGTNETGKSKLNGITKDGWKVFGEEWDQDLQLDWIGEAVRVLKPGGAFILWSDLKKLETVWNALEASGVPVKHTLYWHKTNPAPNPRKNFASAVEGAVFGRKPGKVLHWGGGGFQHNLFRCPKVAGGATRLHPTQKPVSLMEWQVEMVCPPGGVVLDPFMGSGTTGRAALNTGRLFVGVERDPAYYGIARKRLMVAS